MRWTGVKNVVSIVLLAFLSSCAFTKGHYFGETTPKHPPDELWINNSTEPEWTDPGKASGQPDGEIIWNTFAGLTQNHPQTLAPIPDLAERWDVSKDKKTYTFHLRKSAWSDGVPVTADDFEWSWKRVLDPVTVSQYASFPYFLKNGAPFNQRALWVTGISKKTTKQEIQKAFALHVPVDKVDLSDDPIGAFVYLKGEENDLPTLRKKGIEKMNGNSIAGQKISVKITDSSVVGVKALNPTTLQVRLQDPIPYLLYLTCYYSMIPVPRHLIERLIKEGKNPDLWTRPEYVANSGAYQLKEWKFRQYMKFEKNPYYWDSASVKTPKVKIVMVESYNTTLNYYRTAEIDWIGTAALLPAEFIYELSRYKDYQNPPFLSMYYLWLNTKSAPLNDVRVRKALSLAIDRKAIVDHVARANQIPWSTVVPDGLAGYKGLNDPIFDPEKARKLLAEAGYPGGKDFPNFDYIYNTTDLHKQVAETVQQMWNKELGVHANIENNEWKVHLRKLELMDFQVARLGWIGDYPDPYTFLELFAPNNGNNHSNWKSRNYEDVLNAANRTQNPAERLDLLRKSERIIMDNQPVIPLYVYTKPFMKKPYLMGLWPNFQDRHPWKYMWIDSRWYNGVPAQPVADNPESKEVLK